jgi:AraC-like DNA-binding protein
MSEVIFLGSIFCSIITAYLLFFRLPDYQQFSGRILGFSMLFFSLGACIYLLIHSGWILQVPFMFKTAAPVNFLIPPFAYIYIRSVLKDEQKFTAKDYLHFIPAFFVFVNYIPVYFMPALQKQELLQNILKDFSLSYLTGNGYIGEKYLFFARMAQSIVYLFFQWKLVVGYKKELLLDKYEGHTNEVMKWLKTFNWLFSSSMLGYIILFIIVSSDPSLAKSEQIMLIPGYILSFSFLGLSTYLLVHPQVLFGLPYAKSDSRSVHDLHIIKNDTVAVPKEYDEEIFQLKKYFEEQHPYLNNDLNINEVAVALDIPAREVSFIINQHFNQRFTDFVNMYRIKYVNQKIKTGYLNKFTVESLSKEAGFSSKSTFNVAFKKVNLCTPSEYIALYAAQS